MGLFLGFIPVHAGRTLQGVVTKTWTMGAARKEALRDAKHWVDLSHVSSIDPNYLENQKALSEKKERIGNRLLTKFSTGFYAVKIEDSGIAFYYSKEGYLRSIDFDAGEDYPIKSYQHEYPSGRLVRIGLDITPDEAFLFDPKGALITHWIGNYGYDQNNRVILTRTRHSLNRFVSSNPNREE
jgi:hypothetical protein